MAEERKPKEMIVLPDAKVMEWIEEAMKKIVATIGVKGVSLNVLLNEGELLEAVFCVMANIDKFSGYEVKKYNRNWQYVFGLAQKYNEDVNVNEISKRRYVWGIASVYTQGGLNKIGKRHKRDYENYDSIAYAQAKMAMLNFMDERAMDDEKVFYKNGEGWNMVLVSKIRNEDFSKSVEVVYKFVFDDSSDKIKMTVVFDNKKFRSMSDITEIISKELKNTKLRNEYSQFEMAIEKGTCIVLFSIQHQGISDFGYLEDIKGLIKIASESVLGSTL